MSKSNKDKRIGELVKQLEQITLELNQLKSSDSEEEAEIVVGSNVIVTNNYQGEFGSKGVVIKVTKH